MIVHLIDGPTSCSGTTTRSQGAGQERRRVAAVRGVLGSIRGMLNSRVATHVGVATDHVIESFRNNLWPGYKTGDGIEPELRSQFHLLEDVMSAFGVMVWPMVDYEADDALAAAAVKAAADPRVTQVRICRPKRICRSRQRDALVRKTACAYHPRGRGVIAKFGVPQHRSDYWRWSRFSDVSGLKGWAQSRRRRCWRSSGISNIPAVAQVAVNARGRRDVDHVENRSRVAMLFRELARCGRTSGV